MVACRPQYHDGDDEGEEHDSSAAREEEVERQRQVVTLTEGMCCNRLAGAAREHGKRSRRCRHSAHR
jgi:hypothetical protein